MICPLCRQKPKFFAQVNKYVYVRCGACKTIYVRGKLNKEELNSYYRSSFSYLDGRINESIIRKRAQTILKQLHKVKPDITTLCDVGSGFGFFIDEAQKVGYRTMGIEPSRNLATYSQKQFRLPVFHGTLEQYCKKNYNSFDFVTCIHTIEHVVEPKQFVSYLTQILNKNGILFIETPNADSHLVYAEKEKYTFLLAPEHIWIFSRFSFLHMLSSRIKTLRTNTYTYSEHVMGILKTLLKKNIMRSATPSNTQETKGNKKKSLRKIVQYILFDKIIARLLSPLFNVNSKGSILELYMKKKN